MEPGSSAPWLSFQHWLAQHRGVSHERVESSSDSDSAFGDPVALSELPVGHPGQGMSLGRMPEIMPRPAVPDCRLETRLVNEYTCARQQMTVMLAAPGLPAHKAPVVTAKQASALLSAISEPLVQISVGRMTRQLASPVKLQPTEARGVLSLWLLPNDNLSLMWHSSRSVGCGQGLGDTMADPACDSPLLREVTESSCRLAVWEELAHFPAGSQLLEDEPLMTIHMLRGDAGGRAFYLRLRDDIAARNVATTASAIGPDAAPAPQAPEAVAAAAEAAQQRLPALQQAGAGQQQAAPQASSRMYFWLTEPDLETAVLSLGRLKSLLKRSPTLARRAGMPDDQLAQIGSWIARADVALQHGAAAPRVQAAAVADVGAGGGLVPLDCDVGGGPAPPLAGGVPHSLLLARSAAVMPLPPPPDAAGYAYGVPDRAACGRPWRVPSVTPAWRGSATCASCVGATSQDPAAPPPAPAAPPSSRVTSDGSVSATAAAVYQDRRFAIVCPCTISVVAGLSLVARPAPGVPEAEARAALAGVLASRARRLAEGEARRAVDEAGRARVEERLAELLLRSVRVQRAGARAARHEARAAEARGAAAARVLPLIKRAAAEAEARGRRGAGFRSCHDEAAGAEDCTEDEDDLLLGPGWALRYPAPMDAAPTAACASAPPRPRAPPHPGLAQPPRRHTGFAVAAPAGSPAHVEAHSPPRRVSIDDLGCLLRACSGGAEAPPHALTSAGGRVADERPAGPPAAGAARVSLAELPEVLRGEEAGNVTEPTSAHE